MESWIKGAWRIIGKSGASFKADGIEIVYFDSKQDMGQLFGNFQKSYSEGMNFIDLAELMEIINLSKNREPKGYNGSPIFNNRIEFYVNNKKLNDLNEYASLFEAYNINLDEKDFSFIGNFIGYISENAAKYKKSKINLMDVYNYNNSQSGQQEKSGGRETQNDEK
jgi:hypothetical protein